VGAAALGAVLCAAGPAWAQGPQGAPGQQAAAPLSCRVATVNMVVVMKGYKKFDVFRTEMDAKAKPYRDKDKELKDMYKGWQAVAQDAKKSAKEREDAENYLKTLKRQIEDNGANATKVLSALEDDKVVQLYHEIQDAVASYARPNGIHLVLQYTELVSEPDIYSPPNIKRKLQSGQVGACTPMYIADGMDISQAIVTLLNSKFQTGGTPTAAAPAAGPGGH
jgi:Skp family chaperone for outer membrane proteins